MPNLTKLVFLVVLIAFSACKQPIAPTNQTLKLDPKLDRVQNINFISDTNSASFEWNRFDNKQILGVKIYRGKSEKDLKQVGETSKFATHYLDTDLSPNTSYVYVFKTFSATSISAASESIPVKTRDIIGPITFIESIGNLPKQIKLIFKPNDDLRVSKYIIERRQNPKDPWREVQTINGRLNAEFIDTKLLDGTTYYYRVYGKTLDGLNTYPTKTLQARTRPLPPSVQKISASTQEPRRIVVRWDALSDKSLTYNVYRSKSLDGTYELSKSGLKTTAVIDNVKEDGAKYFYKITSVDEEDLESLAGKPVLGQALPKPIAPAINLAQLKGAKATISWVSKDKRVKSYIIKRTHKKNFLSSSVTRSKPIKAQQVTDNLKQEGTYIYEIIGIDEHKIESLPSTPVELEYEIKN